MTTKYQRPLDNYSGASGLSNRDKYQNDSSSQPKVAISSGKMDGDFNYVIDALNEIDEASGTQSSIAARLAMSLNDDGSLKASASNVMDDWISHSVTSLTREDDSTISFGGDYTGTYVENRRVRLTVAGQKLYATVASSSYNSGVTTVNLVDVYNENQTIGVVSVNPTAIAYSPMMPGVIGNAVQRFSQLDVKGLTLTDDMPLTILNDTGVSGKIYAIRSNGGQFEIVENTGTEASPVWTVRATVTSTGLQLDDNAVTTAKIADTAVTGAKLENSGVTAGSYTYSNVTVDGKGRVTAASSNTLSNASETANGIVELATDAEVTAETATGSSGASLVVTPDKIPSIFKKTAETSLGAGTTVTIAHGLGRAPVMAQMFFKCTGAELGYSVGDVITYGTYYNAPGSSGANGGASLSFNTSNFVVTFQGNAYLKVIDKSTRSIVNATLANWRVYIQYI